MSASVVQPAESEVLDGYLDRASYVLGWPVLLVRRSLGLPEPVKGIPLALAIAPSIAASLDKRMQTQPGTAERMTLLGRYRFLAPDVARPSAALLSREASRRWYFISGSRYCPKCLASDGTWRTAWRLPWSLVCPTHQVLLADKCPQCGGWPRSGRGGTAAQRRIDERVRVPHLCHLPRGETLGRGSEQCGTNLGENTTRKSDADEDRINGALDAALVGQTVTIAGVALSGSQAVTAWQELTLITAHLLNERRSRTRLSPPRDTETSARWLKTADTVASAESTAHAVDRLHSLFSEQRVQVDKNWLRDRLPRKSSPLTQLYDEFLRGEGRVSTQLRRSRQQSLGLFRVTEEQIPQLFWSCGLPKDLMHVRGKPSPRMRAVFVSLALARVLTGDWATAASALELPPHKGRQWSRYVIASIPRETRRLVNTEILNTLPLLTDAPRAERVSIRTTEQLLQVSLTPCITENGKQSWCPCIAANASQ